MDLSLYHAQHIVWKGISVVRIEKEFGDFGVGESESRVESGAAFVVEPVVVFLESESGSESSC